MEMEGGGTYKPEWQHLKRLFIAFIFLKSNNCKDRSPPVMVEFPISKPQQLGHKVHRGMEKPVEENQPDEMVGHLQ